MKQTLKIGITVLVVAALTMSGLALAQTGDDAPSEDEVTRGVAGIVEKLAPLVEDGTINEAQAEAVAETLADGLGPHRGPRRGPGPGLETTAEFLGMEVDDLAAQLRGGSTLAEIAGEQADELIEVLIAEAEEHLAQAVEDGKLTQEEADEKLEGISDRITSFVEEGPPPRPGGHRPGGPRGGHGGPGPGGPGGAESDA